MLYVLYKYTYHKMIVKVVNKKKKLLKENTILVFLLQNVIILQQIVHQFVCVFLLLFSMSAYPQARICVCKAAPGLM